tara:strand:- start:145 stop:1143 length:999 start_codon:yes stop_codon:yes gene_type:complete
MSNEQINKDSLRAVLARMAVNNPKFSTEQAKEAQRILKSIKDTKTIPGSVFFDNYDLGTQVRIRRTHGPKSPVSISFMTNTGFERPDKPNTKLGQLGIRAAINQAIDEIPTARDRTGRNAYYEFEAIDDMKDLQNRRPGQTDNQRSKMYRRFSNGAMNPVYEPSSGSMVGRGERIDDTTWQPRGKKGRLEKYVKWELGQPVRRLNNVAQQVVRPLKTIAGFAARSHPYLLALDLIQQDSQKVRTANTDVFDKDGNLTELGRMGLKPTSREKAGPPVPKPKAKSRLVIQPPPKKDTAVLSKKGGKTGSSINGLFIAHPWSAEQRMRYAARGGK